MISSGLPRDGELDDVAVEQLAGGEQDAVVLALGEDDVGLGVLGALEQPGLEDRRGHDRGDVDLEGLLQLDDVAQAVLGDGGGDDGVEGLGLTLGELDVGACGVGQQDDRQAEGRGDLRVEVQVAGADDEGRSVVEKSCGDDGADLGLVVVEAADAEAEGRGQAVNVDTVEVAVDDTEQC